MLEMEIQSGQERAEIYIQYIIPYYFKVFLGFYILNQKCHRDTICYYNLHLLLHVTKFWVNRVFKFTRIVRLLFWLSPPKNYKLYSIDNDGENKNISLIY